MDELLGIKLGWKEMDIDWDSEAVIRELEELTEEAFEKLERASARSYMVAQFTLMCGDYK